MRSHKLTYAALGVSVIVFGDSAWAQQQVVDSDFDASVAAPAYRESGPLVAVDAAHSNFHTADGNYRPFANLLTNDGYRVVSLDGQFEPQLLADVDVLVVANANALNFTDPAFTEDECDVVRDWVRGGGSSQIMPLSGHLLRTLPPGLEFPWGKDGYSMWSLGI